MPPITPASSHPQFAKRPQDLSLGGFDDHHENLHGVEFEAPFSSESNKPPLTQGRFSIDFSIELERQLEMEASPPSSPPPHGNMDANAKKLTGDDAALNGPHPDKELLDPEILAHIITQLRHSLSEMTKERDELVKMLAHANAEEANVKDALQLMTEKATQAEEELDEAKKKKKEDEEQISLLRAKVEESRRGLMRLQTESRRQSMAPIDISRASSLTLPNFGSPPSSKRASFAPLTGSRHGRIPSLSDNNLVSTDHSSASTAYGDTGLSPSPPGSSRRYSGLFGRVSPGIPDNESDAAQAPQAHHAEVEALKVQVKSLKNELESVKHELGEANEAKEASETCVKALREFIAENNIGAMAVKLPPLPTMASGGQDATAPEPKKTGSGWGFKLWGSGSGSFGPATISNGGVSDPHGVATPPPMSAPPSGTCGLPPTPITEVLTPTPSAPAPAPLSRKLTGLFSSRSSVSSRGGSAQAKSQLGASGPPLIDRTNSRCSYSDVSSVVEPISPVLVSEDVNGGLGLGVLKPLGEGGVEVTKLVGGSVGQETPPMSLHEVDLDNGLR